MSSIRILIVEDDNLLRRMFENIFDVHLPDYTFDVAANGELALKKFRANKYNMIITDLSMPVMTGSNMYQEIRSICEEQDRDMPLVLFCSGVRIALDNVLEFCDGKRTRYILKPFAIEDLRDLIEEMLNEQ